MKKCLFSNDAYLVSFITCTEKNLKRYLIKVENGRADIYIQLRGPKHIRMVNYIASIEKEETSRKLMFKKQFVHLAPLFGINDLTCDVNPDEIQKAIA